MRANVDRIHVLQQHVIIVSVDPPVPRCPMPTGSPSAISFSDDGIVYVVARFGYMERRMTAAGASAGRPGTH